jgi:hypothetical protein
MTQPERESDPPEFDPAKVPAGPLGDLFYDGRTGRGLTNAEWDEQRARLREAGDDPFEAA